MKIGFLITARLKSTRLPFKVLRDLNGETVIGRIIERAKEVKDISEIVVCTSTNPQDKSLVDIAKEKNVYYFNGDEEDVIKRLFDAARFFSMDYFIGITADNPLFSIYYSNLVVNEIKRKGSDYIRLNGLPVGVAVYGLNVKALKTLCKVKTVVNTEFWGYLINRPEIFDVTTIDVKGQLNRPDLNLTLDYEEDYELINNIYTNVPFKRIINMFDVVQYLNKNPEVAKINKDSVHLDLDKKTKEEINKNFKERLYEIKNIKKQIYAAL